MILFVDDEPRRMKSYVEDLDLSNYQVEFCSNVSQALKFLEHNYDKIYLVILDVMMPPDNAFDINSSEQGLRTGVCFL